ncbi:Nuclear pore membrane glycoprotein [Toxocara canis]|uniref:Nuclear pore membrane glycoprotein n=1 Tax=Toxocara canis TaxID=6265 RepID=A0A0B2UJG9_TOXCA|nr:Nuclear pore membrane glycoprotein [Toxocara canis]
MLDRSYEVGETLELSVGLFVEWKDELIAVTDCRHVEFAFSVVDDAVFTIINDHVPQASLYGGGCSSVMLKAIADGDTKVAVSLDSFSADVRVSAYPPLKVRLKRFGFSVMIFNFHVSLKGQLLVKLVPMFGSGEAEYFAWN